MKYPLDPSHISGIIVGNPTIFIRLSHSCKLVASVSSRTDLMMSRPSTPFSIINTWNKLTCFQHHHRFLSRCLRLNKTPSIVNSPCNFVLKKPERAKCLLFFIKGHVRSLLYIPLFHPNLSFRVQV